MKFLSTIVFLLVMQITNAQPNADCNDAITLSCGQTYTVDYGGHDPDANYYFADCNRSISNPGVWYRYVGTGDITFLSLCATSPQMIVFTEGCEQLQCFNKFSGVSYYQCSTNATSTEITFLSEPEQEYLIFCYSINSQNTSDLTVTCVEPAVNNFCDGALSVAFNENFYVNHEAHSYSREYVSYQNNSLDSWYAFVGTGDYVLLERLDGYGDGFFNDFYTGDCNNLTFLEPTTINNRFAVPTVNGESYYFRIQGNFLEDRLFQLQSLSPAINDQCADALPFSISDTITVSADYMALDDQPCRRSGNYNLWYKIDGNDQIIHYDPVTSFYDISLDGVLTSCISDECLDLTAAGTRRSFFAHQDSTYYLSIAGRFFETGDGKFTTHAALPVANNTYQTATNLICGDSIIGRFNNATEDIVLNRSRDPSVWYSITGTGNYYQVTANIPAASEYYQPHLEVFRATNLEKITNTDRGGYYYLENDSNYYFNWTNPGAPQDTFIVEADCQPPVGNDICETATPITLTDTLHPIDFLTVMDRTEDCNGNLIDKIDTWYQFTGDGAYYDLSLDTERYNFSFSVFTGDCDNLQCEVTFTGSSFGGWSGSRRLYLAPEQAYYLVFDTQPEYYAPDSSDVQFYFELITPAENDECANATLLNEGMTVRDSLDFAIRNDTYCPDEYNSYEGAGIWYQIEGDGNYVELIFDKSTSNASVDLFTGSCNNLICADDKWFAYKNRLTIFAESGETYYFMIDDFYLSPYEFEVRKRPAAINDNYEQAILLEDGESYDGYVFGQSTNTLANNAWCNNDYVEVWFKLVGQDNLIKIIKNGSNNITFGSIHQLENEELVCRTSIHRDYEIDFKFLQNQEYYLRGYFRNQSISNYEEDYNFSVGFQPTVINDECIGAIPIECGITYSLEHDLASNNELTDNQCFTSSNRPTSWYKIIGDDTWRDFTFIGTDYTYGFEVYEGDNCNELECVYPAKPFFAATGQTYWLMIRGEDVDEVQFTMNCTPNATNDLCRDAELLECNMPITGKLGFAQPCDEDDVCNDYSYSGKTIWYRLIGNDNFVDLELTIADESRLYGININVFLDDCCTRRSIPMRYGTRFRPQFFAESGHEYLVVISSSPDDNYNYTFTANCSDAADYSLCENAPLIDAEPTTYRYPDNLLEYPVIYWEQIQWFSFKGSGAVDTIRIENPAQHRLELFYFIATDQCQLSPQLYNSGRYHSQATINIPFYSVANTTYRLGVRIDQAANAHTVQEMTYSYHKGAEAVSCQMNLPAEIFFEPDQEVAIPIEITDYAESVDVFVAVNNVFTYHYAEYEFMVGDSFRFVPEVSGRYLFQLRGETCTSYAQVDFYDMTSPDNITCNPDDLTCEPSIQHSSDALRTSVHKSESIIESTAQVMSGAQVLYQAGESITLQAGFKVENGAQFTATTEVVCPEEMGNEMVTERSIIINQVSDDNILINNELSIVPNPFYDQFTLIYQSEIATETQWLLFSAEGRLMQTGQPQTVAAGIPQQCNINTQSLPPGLYFIRLQTPERQLVQKLIKTSR